LNWQHYTCTIQYSTLHYSTVQYTTVHYSTILYSHKNTHISIHIVQILRKVSVYLYMYYVINVHLFMYEALCIMLALCLCVFDVTISLNHCTIVIIMNDNSADTLANVHNVQIVHDIIGHRVRNNQVQYRVVFEHSISRNSWEKSINCIKCY